MDIRQVILLVLAVVVSVQSRPGISQVCSQAADIVFVLDSSTSIWIEDFKRQLTFVQDVVKMFDVGQGPTQARVGILTFGNKVWIDYTLDKFSDVESLIDAVEKIPHKAGTTTNAWEALDTLTTKMFTPKMGSRLNVSHIAIVITDGRSQKTMLTKVSAEAMHDAGINTFAIGVGQNIDLAELGYIASDPDKEFLFQVDNCGALESIKGIIADKTCQVTQEPVTLPSTTPTTKSQSDRDTVVTVTPMHIILQSTTSLPEPQGDREPEVISISQVCSQAADIVFVLDSSTSIWIEDFKRQLTFVQDVVKIFDVGQGPTQARVGILTFGNKVWIDYTLDKFSDVESLIDAVEKIPHKAGTTTNTWEALDTLTTKMFTPKMGSRLNVSHIAIVITDGRSQKTMITKVSAEAMHDAGINTFAIGVGQNIDLAELGYIASDPDKEFLFQVDNCGALESIKGIIADKTCQVAQEPVTLPSTTPTTKSQSDRDTVVTVTPMHIILQSTTSLPEPQGDREPEVISISQVCSQAADIVFVLDSSTSIWIEDFKRQLTFVQDVVKIFDVGQGPTQARVGILTFGNKVWIDYTLDKFSDVESLIDAVEKIPHKAGTTTNTWEALDTLTTKMFTPKMGSRLNVSHIAIVITDGRSQKTMLTKVSAEAMHDAGINTFAIGVGQNIDLAELGYIASDPDKEFLFQVDNCGALESIKGIIADKTCQVTQKPVILPSTTPTTKSQSDRDTVVTVTQMDTILHSTTSLPKPQGDRDPDVTNCGGKPADVYFVIDSSASIGDNNFRQVLNFVKNIVSIFDIGKDKTRVGLLTFSHDVQDEIPLNNRFTKEELLKIIVDVKYTVGGTNTGKALEFVRTVGFSKEIARPGVAHVAIVVTDGMSKNPIETARQAELAHKAGIYTFAIGVGDDANLQELRDIASNPDEDFVFKANDFHSLDSIKKLLAVRTCDIKSNDKPVDINGDNMYVCTPAVKTDLLFTYDSVAIGSWKSQTVSQFIGALVNGFERNGLVRVGRVTSDCQRSGNIALTQELSNVAFSRLEFTTYTHLIRKVRRHGFSVEQGGRPEARRIAVMIVDEELEDLNSEMISEAQKLNKEAEVYVVVVGKANNLPLVHELAMVNGVVDQGHIIDVDSYQKIFLVKGELLRRLCLSMSSDEITRDQLEVDKDEDYDYVSIPKSV